MYNDYYLEQINNKLATTNSNLETIITNQNTLIDNQEIIYNSVIGIDIVIALILLYLFVVRCMKN